MEKTPETDVWLGRESRGAPVPCPRRPGRVPLLPCCQRPLLGLGLFHEVPQPQTTGAQVAVSVWLSWAGTGVLGPRAGAGSAGGDCFRLAGCRVRVQWGRGSSPRPKEGPSKVEPTVATTPRRPVSDSCGAEPVTRKGPGVPSVHPVPMKTQRGGRGRR